MNIGLCLFLPRILLRFVDLQWRQIRATARLGNAYNLDRTAGPDDKYRMLLSGDSFSADNSRLHRKRSRPLLIVLPNS